VWVQEAACTACLPGCRAGWVQLPMTGVTRLTASHILFCRVLVPREASWQLGSFAPPCSSAALLLTKVFVLLCSACPGTKVIDRCLWTGCRVWPSEFQLSLTPGIEPGIRLGLVLSVLAMCGCHHGGYSIQSIDF
jgi:hypothetical protein